MSDKVSIYVAGVVCGLAIGSATIWLNSYRDKRDQTEWVASDPSGAISRIDHRDKVITFNESYDAYRVCVADTNSGTLELMYPIACRSLHLLRLEGGDRRENGSIR
jgi:hypothetical protein